MRNQNLKLDGPVPGRIILISTLHTTQQNKEEQQSDIRDIEP